MRKEPKEQCTVTLSTQGRESVTISGNLFHQVAHSYKQPTLPCRNCGSDKWGKTKYHYWICWKCGQLSGWRKGDELRKVGAAKPPGEEEK